MQGGGGVSRGFHIRTGEAVTPPPTPLEPCRVTSLSVTQHPDSTEGATSPRDSPRPHGQREIQTHCGGGSEERHLNKDTGGNVLISAA